MDMDMDMDMDTWTWTWTHGHGHGHGHMDMDMDMDMDTWTWTWTWTWRVACGVWRTWRVWHVTCGARGARGMWRTWRACGVWRAAARLFGTLARAPLVLHRQLVADELLIRGLLQAVLFVVRLVALVLCLLPELLATLIAVGTLEVLGDPRVCPWGGARAQG
eukprot:4925664-Prymnesium_polylepis.1